MANEISKKSNGVIVKIARWLYKTRPGRAMGDAIGLTVDAIERSLYWIFLTGIIGSLLSLFAVPFMNLHVFIGQMMADWCLSGGSCDYYSNITAVALGLFISVSIGVYLYSMRYWFRRKVRSDLAMIYEAVRDADRDGISVEDIKIEAGIEYGDTMSGVVKLVEIGEIVVRKNSNSRTPIYRLAKFGRYDDDGSLR